jgi:hypothetical protein
VWGREVERAAWFLFDEGEEERRERALLPSSLPSSSTPLLS